MSKLRRSLIAEQDLLAIWDHIAVDSPAAADRMWQRFQERFKLLEKFPEMGESRDTYRPKLRSIVEGNYVIFYEPLPDGILIYRVLHGAQRWEEMLSTGDDENA